MREEWRSKSIMQTPLLLRADRMSFRIIYLQAYVPRCLTRAVVEIRSREMASSNSLKVHREMHHEDSYGVRKRDLKEEDGMCKAAAVNLI